MNEKGEIKHYWKLRNEICVEEELVYYGMRLVNPKALRKYILIKLRETHMAIIKTRARARQLFYYPNINAQIENYISSCSVCTTFSKSKIKSPMLSHSILDLSLNKIALDIAQFSGKNYLIIEDYFSRWLEIILLENKTCEAVIYALKAIFGRLGIPDEVIADNMLFGNYKFEVFSKLWVFKITTSSPHYLQSNGLAEQGVGIAKDMLKKSKHTGIDIQLFLLEYRNAPITGLSYSPAQLLQSRELKSTQIVRKQNLKPKVVSNYQKIEKIKNK